MDKEIYTKEEIVEALKDQRRYSLDKRIKELEKKRFEKSFKNITKWSLILVIYSLFEVFFSFFRLENRLNKNINNPKKILVIKLEHIGDVILSTPVYREIKKFYPNIRLYVITTSNIEDTLKNNPYIDKIININPRFTNRSLDKLNFIERINIDIKNILNILKIMLFLKPDITISLRNDFNNVFLNYFSGARIRIAYDVTPYFYLLTNRVKYDSEIHEIERNFRLLKEINIDVNNKDLELFPEEEFRYVDKIFKNNCINRRDLIICMHIGGSGDIKWWPIERFIKIADYLIKNYKAKIIILGKGKDEENKANILKNKFKKNIIKSFDSSVLQKAAIINRSKLLICNDSGPMHIGVAVKTPVIALFGPGAYKYYRPLDNIHTVIYKHLPCSPCAPFIRNDKNDCPENICMKLISTQEVIGAIEEKLKL